MDESTAAARRKVVADFFREQARWRKLKAEEHPEDARNARAAEGLIELANFVEQLPLDDVRFKQLGATTLGAVSISDGIFHCGQEASQYASRFQFHNRAEDEDPDRFLSWFTDHYVEEARQAEEGTKT
jgi:hypothetical protein